MYVPGWLKSAGLWCHHIWVLYCIGHVCFIENMKPLTSNVQYLLYIESWYTVDYNVLFYFLTYLGLCIMWLPPFLAKPANAPQEHANLQPPVKWGHSFYWMFGHTDTKNVDPVWPAVHQCQQFLSPSAPLHHPCNRSGLAEWSSQEF